MVCSHHHCRRPVGSVLRAGLTMRLILALLLSASSLAHAASPYTNNLTGPDVFYGTAKEACEQMIPTVTAYWNDSQTNGKTITFTYQQLQLSGACQYNFVRSDGVTGSSRIARHPPSIMSIAI